VHRIGTLPFHAQQALLFVRAQRTYDDSIHAWVSLGSRIAPLRRPLFVRPSRSCSTSEHYPPRARNLRAGNGTSLAERQQPPLLPVLAQGPVPLPADWLTYVNAPQTEAELERIRRSVMRGCPYGGADWVQRAAAELGLQSTLRPRGRPRRPPTPAPMTDQAMLF